MTEDQRVYKPCIYPVACIIIVKYVDNHGVRHNCQELLAEFDQERIGVCCAQYDALLSWSKTLFASGER